MIQKVYNYIISHNMIKSQDKVLVGVSGGADSVCLLVMLKELGQKMGFDVVAVHVEHGIRGEESLRDAQYVENLCGELEIPFKQYSFDVIDIAKKRGLSVEEAGREIRYETFEKALQHFEGNKIAVAHNMNDNGETVLFNLARGTGLLGIGGIVPKRGKIIRPLLCLKREEIESFLKGKNIAFCVDSTNLEDKYTRNKIRHTILEDLKREINPQVIEHLYNTSEIVREANDYISSQVNSAWEHCGKMKDNIVTIDLKRCKQEPLFLRKEIIKYGIKLVAKQEKDITAAHINDVICLCEKESGKRLNLPHDLIVRKNFDELEIKKSILKENVLKMENIPIEIPGTTSISPDGKIQIIGEVFPCKRDFVIDKKICTKCFDYDKIRGTLVIRGKNANDTIIIDKEGNRQRLKKYFISEKIPVEKRDEVMLLADDNEVLWVIGHRISEAYKVTDSTKTILKIQMKGVSEDD